jgi:hypothetical protein
MEDRFHKENKEISPQTVDPLNTFLLIDSKAWRKPGIISVEKLGNVFQIQINEDILKKNVTAVAFSNQDEMPELPPDTLAVNPQTHICVDENYLYVWVPQSKRWKRLPLSIW